MSLQDLIEEQKADQTYQVRHQIVNPTKEDFGFTDSERIIAYCHLCLKWGYKRISYALFNIAPSPNSIKACIKKIYDKLI